MLLPAPTLTPTQIITQMQSEGACEDLSEVTSFLCSNPLVAPISLKVKAKCLPWPTRPVPARSLPLFLCPHPFLCHCHTGLRQAPFASGPLYLLQCLLTGEAVPVPHQNSVSFSKQLSLDHAVFFLHSSLPLPDCVQVPEKHKNPQELRSNDNQQSDKRSGVLCYALLPSPQLTNTGVVRVEMRSGQVKERRGWHKNQFWLIEVCQTDNGPTTATVENFP